MLSITREGIKKRQIQIPNKEKSLLSNFVMYKVRQKFKKRTKKNYNEQSWTQTTVNG